VNIPPTALVVEEVFRPRHRRHPFADFIPWSDYRVAGLPRPIRPYSGSPWGGRRRHQLGRVLVGLAILVAVVYLLQRLTGRNRNANWF
jgi:hypothetical protein